MVRPVIGVAIDIGRGAVLRSGDSALARFVFIDLRCGRGLFDFRKREAVALLHVEHRLVAENERNALILARAFLVLLRIFREAASKRQSGSVFAFADVAFQCLRLLERKPKWRAVLTRPKQKDVDSPAGRQGLPVLRGNSPPAKRGAFLRSSHGIMPALRLEMMRSVTVG